MRLSFISMLLSAALSSARIVNIAAPVTISPGDPFRLTLITENYIQTVADIAVAYGYNLPTTNSPTGYKYTLGSYLSSNYLGPKESNTLQNVTVYAIAPAALNSTAFYGKQVVLSVGVWSAYGASSSPVTAGYNVTVTVGGCTSHDVVVSQGTGWTEAAA